VKRLGFMAGTGIAFGVLAILGPIVIAGLAVVLLLAGTGLGPVGFVITVFGLAALAIVWMMAVLWLADRGSAEKSGRKHV
jgi:hypothetical protein